jgi:hypothetical protein
MSTTTTIDAAGTIVSDPLQETARHAVAMAQGQVVHQQAQHQTFMDPGESWAQRLVRVAVEQGKDLTYVERLIKLAQDVERDQAVKAFNEAKSLFSLEAVVIVKSKTVDFTSRRTGTRTNYSHAELFDVIEQAGPILAKYGFSWSWVPEQEKSYLWITCVLRHKQGHEETARLGGPPDDSGNKNSTQQISSTATMLERQTLKMVAGLAEKGDDNDGRGARGPHDDGEDEGGRGPGRPEAPPPPPPAAPPEYTDEEFAEKLPPWVDQLTIPNEKSGKCIAPERLIAFIESKGKRFTQAQKDKLTSYKPPF